MNDTVINSVDVTAENFNQLVVEASQECLIVLDFWATWCGPCQSLMPILEKLAVEYNGGFRLAKVNIDEQQELAAQFAVRSVPTVKFIKQGQLVEEFMGAQPEGEIRTLLDKHVAKESDKLLDVAIAQYEAGETEQAISAIQDISKQDPNNPRIALVYADLMIRQQRYDQAKEVLESLPYEMRQSDEVAAMMAKIQIATNATDLPPEAELVKAIEDDPGNCKARHQLSNLYSMSGDYEKAMQQLLEIVKRDRQFEDDIGRKSMLKLFDLLGDNELVHQYRRKMMAALY